MTPRVMQLACTIVSIVPFEVNEEKPGLIPGRFHIAASDGVEPILLHIQNAMHYVYLDENRGSLPARDPSDEVAKSIVNDFVQAQLGISETAFPGIFWVPGALTLEEIKSQYSVELIKARSAQRAWMNNICRMADDDWNRYHKHSVISDFQRKSAEILGWSADEHEWMNTSLTINPEKCPNCQIALAKGTVLCPSCRCVLDLEKYKKLQFA